MILRWRPFIVESITRYKFPRHKLRSINRPPSPSGTVKKANKIFHLPMGIYLRRNHISTKKEAEFMLNILRVSWLRKGGRMLSYRAAFIVFAGIGGIGQKPSNFLDYGEEIVLKYIWLTSWWRVNTPSTSPYWVEARRPLCRAPQ